MIDYILKFPSLAAAQADTVVGTRLFSPILVFHTKISSVDPLSGYWLLITSAPDASLASHPNTQVVSDNALARAGQPSVSLAAIDISDISVVISPLGLYIADGLRHL